LLVLFDYLIKWVGNIALCFSTFSHWLLPTISRQLYAATVAIGKVVSGV